MVNFKALGGNIRSMGLRTGHALSDHSPQIFTGAAIVGSTAAVGFAIFAAVKKLPQIQEEYEAALADIQNTITDPFLDARAELEEIGDEAIDRMYAPEFDTDPETQQHRAHVEALETVCKDGPLLEANYVARAKMQRVGKVLLAFLPAALCLTGSIFSSLAVLKITSQRALSAAAYAAGLSAELAATRKEHKESIGEVEMAKKDIAALTEKTVDEDGNEVEATDELKKRLYCRLYTDHLTQSMTDEQCLRFGEIQLKNYERTWNHKLLNNKEGRVYFGDVLRSMGYQSNECGQNCGWMLRGYPCDDFDGYIDFGCWTEPDPVTGEKTLNPANIGENGEILLDFNVEGKIVNLIPFRDRD